MTMQATLDERAELVAQRNRLELEAHALGRQLDSEEQPASYEEASVRKDQEQRLAFLRYNLFDLQGQIDALDRAAHRTEAEKRQVRDYLDAQLKAARARLARVEYENENLQPVLAALARRHERALGEIASFEAQLRVLEPPTPAPREAPATTVPATETTPVPPTETTPPPRIPAPSLARRVRSALAWSADPNDDSGDET